MIFKTKTKVHFDEADPAGIAFSGTIFTKMHRCYEEFIEALGENPRSFFLNPELIFPIRHVETEYLKPMLPLQEYEVHIGVTRVSETSFQLRYDIRNNEQVHCMLKSTHVCVDPKKMEKSLLPTNLKESLKNFAIEP